MLVGVIDSGIGGLNIIKKVLEENKNDQFIYLSDTLFFPYGKKTKEELFLRVSFLIEELLRIGVKKIILACNTISALIYEDLKRKYQVPIVDMISMFSKYFKDNNIQKITLLGSEALINSQVYQKIFIENNIEYEEIAVQELIRRIEHNLDIKDELERLKEIIDKDTEIILLACTHLIKITPEIKDIFNKKVLSQIDIM